MQKLHLTARSWIGWLESPADGVGFASAPAYVLGIQPLKSGKGLLELDLAHPIAPLGRRRRSITVKVIAHDVRQLVCTFDAEGLRRVGIAAEASMSWLRTYCPELLRRRPVYQSGLLINGKSLGATTSDEHYGRVFGTDERGIVGGAQLSSFGDDATTTLDRFDTFTVGRELDPFYSCLASRGFVPHEMEEKWFIYLEGEHLLFRRSWTGSLIYDVEAIWRGSRLYLGTARVNRDPDQYAETDASYDRRLLNFLIDAILLGVPASFPHKAEVDEREALQAWSVAGSASGE